MLTKKELRTRRFVAKYIQYLTVFGYLFVAFIGIAVAVLWFVKVDEVASAGGEIRPHEKTVKHKAEAVVLKVFVENHADVTAEQKLVEICDEPEWVERYRSVQKGDPEQLARMRAEMPVSEELRAPLSGVVIAGEDLEGKIIPAKWDIVKVLDFDDLRITAEIKGKNVVDVEPGQRVKVEAAPTYDNKELLRSDVAYPGWWRRGRAQFSTVGEGKIKDMLQEYFAESALQVEDEEDKTFSISKVTKVELEGVLRVEDASGWQESESVRAEPFVGAMLEGEVIEATHTASVTIRDLPDDVRSAILETLMERFQGGLRVDGSGLSTLDSLRSKIEWPLLERLRKGLREDDAAALSVLGIDDLKAFVRVDSAYKQHEESAPSDGSSLLVDDAERKCWAVVKLRDLPPGFRERTREMALREKPRYMPVGVKVVTGQRRIAMLLFRKN